MRKFPVILIALGAFLVVLAPMARWYAYPKLAVAPDAQRSVTVLDGPDATIFDIGTLKEIQTDVTVKANTVGDVKASDKAPGNAVVWVTTSSTESADGVMRASDVERVAFDAHTGEAVNCCDEFISEAEGEEEPVEHKGLVVKFPFGTEKKTYQWWDGTIRDTVPVRYTGTDERNGVKVYRFEGTVEPTEVGTMQLPLSLLGETGSDNVTVQQMYSNKRTLWVEPNTGVVIDRSEEQNNTLDYQGEPRITTTKVTASFSDATIKENTDKYGTLGTLLYVLHTVVPIVALVLGVVLIALGLVLGRRRRPEGEPQAKAPVAAGV